MILESLDAYFADFAVVCTVGAKQINAIFEDPYAPGLGSLMEERTEPLLLCMQADVESVRHGTSVEVEGQAGRFVVGGIEQEGTGLTRLVLTRK